MPWMMSMIGGSGTPGCSGFGSGNHPRTDNVEDLRLFFSPVFQNEVNRSAFKKPASFS
jgi:hypothetical protein